MIYGDPYKFALQFDFVDAWNMPDNYWKNGIFALYIDGIRVFSTVETVELRTTFASFKNIPFAKVGLSSKKVTATKVFKNAFEYFWGDNWDDNRNLMKGVIELGCTAMGDKRLHLYLMRSPVEDRLVWSSDYGVTVSEYILDAGYIANVLDSMPADFVV